MKKRDKNNICSECGNERPEVDHKNGRDLCYMCAGEDEDVQYEDLVGGDDDDD